MEEVQGNTGAAKAVEPAATTTEPVPAAETGAATTQAEKGCAEIGEGNAEEASDAQPVDAEHPRTLMNRIRATIAHWGDEAHEAVHEDLLAVERLLGIVD